MSTIQEQIDYQYEVKAKNDAAIGEQQKQINSYRQAITQLHVQIDGFNTNIDACNTQISELEADNLIVEDTIASLESLDV